MECLGVIEKAVKIQLLNYINNFFYLALNPNLTQFLYLFKKSRVRLRERL